MNAAEAWRALSVIRQRLTTLAILRRNEQALQDLERDFARDWARLADACPRMGDIGPDDPGWDEFWAQRDADSGR